MAYLEIKLKRANKTYLEGDIVAGLVSINSPSDLTHQGLTLILEGGVTLYPGTKRVGIFDAMTNSIKPVDLIKASLELAKPGKLPAGRTDIPFEVPLKPKTGKKLFETFHGVFIKIRYLIHVTLKRSAFSKDIQSELEFLLEGKPGPSAETYKAAPVDLSVTPGTLKNIKEKVQVPDFKMSLHYDSANCKMSDPFTGTFCLESCDVAIKSVELQLARLETCGCADGYSEDCTEIQNIQLADGDIARKLHIPVHMILPRMFTCPTLITPNFKVEFLVNLMVIFKDDVLISERCPIKIFRV